MGSVAIIGGGPAGLASAYALGRAGVDFVLFEEGPPLLQREHDRAEQLGIGVGGAGLFSDGKFSFHPSGTHLYALAAPDRLRGSYERVAELLRDSGIPAPSFPNLHAPADSSGAFRAKTYPSSYGTLDQRIRLTAALAAPARGRLRSFCKVSRIERRGPVYALSYRNGTPDREGFGLFDAVILATGRFGGLALDRLFSAAPPADEQRYEVGIRIEHRNEVGFLRHSKTPDVKFVLDQQEVEVRTFCTCRRGEVWMIPYADLSALSGRSDGPPSAYSNFGLLPRFAEGKRDVGRDVWNHFRSTWGGREAALWQPLPEFLTGAGIGSAAVPADRPWHPRERFVRGDLEEALHPGLSAILKASLRAIIDRYPDMLSPETMCLFPAVEGAGRFPRTDAGLRVGNEKVWCCGDVVGRFRGLIPALVSGHYAGTAAALHLGAAAVDNTAAVAETA